MRLLTCLACLLLSGCCDRPTTVVTICSSIPLPPKPELVGTPEQQVEILKRHAAELRWNIQIHNDLIREREAHTPP